ncbi:Scr1 family TA system antitoxin-like transcriptional regulator [Streptomyces sp. NPDC005355]|uniref:Scr1 family TA system antitoxin-like transcriptional regulator n=1 Tax=Streptomyces sp. NPDC005355 TaxID=3157038 RepID=UPI0033BC2B39
MTTDFQTAREALGARLRELRAEAGLEGKDIASKAGWQTSKVSRLQNGKQTPTRADLTAWANAVGRPDAEPELHGLLAGLDMKQRHRSWRRQLAGGHRGRQEIAVRQTENTTLIRGLEVSRIPGLFQTPEYARVIFDSNAEFRGIPPTTEAAVETRMRRQQALYDPEKTFRFLVCEAALYHRSCPVAPVGGLLAVAAGPPRLARLAETERRPCSEEPGTDHQLRSRSLGERIRIHAGER